MTSSKLTPNLEVGMDTLILKKLNASEKSIPTLMRIHYKQKLQSYCAVFHLSLE